MITTLFNSLLPASSLKRALRTSLPAERVDPAADDALAGVLLTDPQDLSATRSLGTDYSRITLNRRGADEYTKISFPLKYGI